MKIDLNDIETAWPLTYKTLAEAVDKNRRTIQLVYRDKLEAAGLAIRIGRDWRFKEEAISFITGQPENRGIKKKYIRLRLEDIPPEMLAELLEIEKQTKE